MSIKIKAAEIDWKGNLGTAMVGCLPGFSLAYEVEGFEGTFTAQDAKEDLGGLGYEYWEYVNGDKRFRVYK